MSARLRDVAQRAGVSVKTVSNVVNGHVHVTPKTREKVQRALVELDYRPNMSARGLRRGRTGIIALALPNLHNPYFSELAQVVVKETEARSLTVLIDCTDGIREREQLALEAFRTQLIDGLILLPWRLTAADLRARRDDTPLVLLGERLVRSAHSIAIDSRAAARTATQHLIELGRRRIGMIAGVPGSAGVKMPKLREMGYQDALADAGIEFDSHLIEHPNGFAPADTAEAMARLLASPEQVDGVFCHNDTLALEAMRHLLSSGIRVPEDVAVVGIDDIQAGQISTPTLSTISPDKHAIAHDAVGMLVERLGRDGDEPARHVSARFTLIARESTVGVTAR